MLFSKSFELTGPAAELVNPTSNTASSCSDFFLSFLTDPKFRIVFDVGIGDGVVAGGNEDLGLEERVARRGLVWVPNRGLTEACFFAAGAPAVPKTTVIFATIKKKKRKKDTRSASPRRSTEIISASLNKLPRSAERFHRFFGNFIC